MNQDLNCNNNYSANYGTREYSREAEGLQLYEGWKISSSPHIPKPLPQKPLYEQVSKKTKPLPCLPHYYVEQQYYPLDFSYYVSPTSNYYQNQTQEIPAMEQNYHEPQFARFDYQQPSIQASHLNSSALSADKLHNHQEPLKKSLKDTDKNVRQITVRSISDEHRVWINIEPKETGISIAKKVHTIATFRTQRILTVTTASGRKIALDKTPVFHSWEDFNNFENGETWDFTYGPLNRSKIDKFLSKIIQV